MTNKKLIEELLNKFANESYDALLAIATFSLTKILPIFEQLTESESKGVSIVLSFVTSSLAADNNLSQLEKRFVKELFKLNNEEVEQLYNFSIDKEVINEFVNNVYDASPVEIQKHLLTFICCFLSIDKRISYHEVNFLKKIIDRG